jgi:hypothetical protein
MFSHRWSACAFPIQEELLSRAAVWASALIVLVGALAIAQSAHAHGIAGNRLFPGTLSFDDPAVADELALTPLASAKHPAIDGSEVNDKGLSWTFIRLLTPTIAVGVESGWIHRNWGAFQRSGFETTNVTIKGALYRNDLHETLVSAGLAWGIGHSGAQGVGGNLPDTVQPGIFFGKGLGDLPDRLAWLRPFAITGAITGELPTTSTSTNFGIDAATGALAPMVSHHVDTLHWGFSIQYSTLYLTDRFRPGRPPKNEPLNQWVPLVEFAFDSPHGQKTAATMNPGLSYVGNTWQVAVEAIVPLNSEAGRGIGARMQLLLFLDDLIPSVFGKPLLSH